MGLTLAGDPEEWIAAAGRFATPQERVGAARFRHALDAARHLAGRALARRMLGPDPDRPLEAEFALSPWGKPMCPPGAVDPETGAAPPDFSITHSGAMVWVAVCHADRVGIDVEQTRPLPDVHELAAQLHKEECADIRALPAPERATAFYRCWTRKEAVLKAIGRGLQLPLADFRVRIGPEPADWLATPPSEAWDTAWTTRDIAAGPEHQCCVAACAAGLPLTVLQA